MVAWARMSRVSVLVVISCSSLTVLAVRSCMESSSLADRALAMGNDRALAPAWGAHILLTVAHYPREGLGVANVKAVLLSAGGTYHEVCSLDSGADHTSNM